MPPSPARPSSAAAHAFVSDLAEPALDDEDHHHFERVLRLQPGQTVTVSDGAGGWRRCAWRAAGRLEVIGPVETLRWREPTVTIAFALTKGERPEWVVQKLTELGVDRILPFRAGRSVVRWDEEKADAQRERWRRVARLAAMQSRRVRIPEVTGIVAFDRVVGDAGPAAALAAPAGGPVTLDRPTVVIGPEGGWEDQELACGLPTVGLGPTILRAETAALAAAVVLCGLRDGTLRPVPEMVNENHLP